MRIQPIDDRGQNVFDPVVLASNEFVVAEIEGTLYFYSGGKPFILNGDTIAVSINILGKRSIVVGAKLIPDTLGERSRLENPLILQTKSNQRSTKEMLHDALAHASFF